MKVFEVIGHIDADDHGATHLVNASTKKGAADFYGDYIGKGFTPESVREVDWDASRKKGEMVYVVDPREVKRAERKAFAEQLMAECRGVAVKSE